MASENLNVVITANAQNFSSTLSKMGSDLKGVEKNFEGLSKLGEGMKNVGKKLTTGLTLPIIGVAGASAKMSMDFENSFAKVSTLLDSSTTDFNSYKEDIKGASKEMGVGVNEFNESLYQSMSAGVEAGDAIKFTSDMVKLAKGGFTDTATAVDLTTTVLNSYGKQAGDTSDIMDKLIQTQNLGKTTVAELGTQLGGVIPIAKGCGVAFNDMLASMATMTAGGIGTAEATTYLKSMINELGKSGTKVSGILKDETGMSFQELNEKGVPLGETLKTLKDYADKNNLSFQDLFGSSEAATAALALMGDEGVKLQENLDGISNSAGSADEAFKKVDNTAGAKLAKAFNSLKISMIEIGDALSPLIVKFAEFVTKISDWIAKFGELSPATQNFILAIVGIVAAIGPLLSIAGTLIGAFVGIQGIMAITGLSFMALCTPILIVVGVIAGIIAIGILLCQNWETIKSVAETVWNGITTTITNMITTCQGLFTQFISFLTGIWNGLTGIVSTVWTTICNVIQVAVMLIGSIISGAFQIITIPFRFIWENCKSVVISIWNSISSTISTVVGTISSFVSSKFTAMTSTVSRIFNKIKAVASSVWNGIKSVIMSVAGAIYSTVSSKFNQVKSSVTSIFNAIKGVASSVWNGVKSTISSAVGAIKSNVTSVFNSVKSTVTNIWNGIKSAITGPINSAKSAVSSAMSAIKRAVNVSLKPNLKLPHISVSGKLSLNPPSVPKISVSWYKNGGIMTKPTLFGGGEAGAEAILPLDKIQGYFDKAYEKTSNTINYSKMEKAFEKALEKMDLNVIMSEKKVGQLTSNSVNQEIKRKTKLNNRLAGVMNV